MKASKLPSGNWRCRVYAYTDSSGKKIYESFTADSKTEVEMLAAQFKNSVDRARTEDLTIKEAVENYIQGNKRILSPSTIDGYIKDARSFKPIEHLRIRRLTSHQIQLFIQELSDKGLSPKTIKNRYGLLRSVLTYCGVSTQYSIHLPKAEKKRKYAPENEQIKALFNAAPHKMKVCIVLGMHSLRRGEVAAVKYKDLKGNALSVHADIVKDPDSETGWTYKPFPKTDGSNRTVYLTDDEVKLIGTGNPEDYIVGLIPSSIGTNFSNLKKKVGLEHIRFHDLRVFFVSISAALKIPEVYTAYQGGWTENSRTIKEHYKKPIESFEKKYTDKLNDFLGDMTRNMTQN